MKTITLTCPFTGVDFQAMKSDETGDYIFTNPLTGQMLYAKNGVIKTTVKELFTEHLENVSPIEAAQILGVTRQRITQLLNDELLPYYHVNGKKRILVRDIMDYKENKQR